MPLDCAFAVTSSSANAIDSSRNSAGSSSAVGEAELVRLGAGQHPVLAHRVLDDELHGGLGADEPRHELRAAPGREDAEEAPRAGEVADAVEIVRASQCSAISTPPPRQAPLTAATVGNGSARIRPKSSWPARLPSIACSRVALGNSVDVGAGGEDERLAGEHERRPVALLELGEHALERLERRAAEDGRLRVVLAVVDRHERERRRLRSRPAPA